MWLLCTSHTMKCCVQEPTGVRQPFGGLSHQNYFDICTKTLHASFTLTLSKVHDGAFQKP